MYCISLDLHDFVHGLLCFGLLRMFFFLGIAFLLDAQNAFNAHSVCGGPTLKDVEHQFRNKEIVQDEGLEVTDPFTVENVFTICDFH